MKRINRVAMGMLMLLLLASACTSSSGNSPVDLVDSDDSNSQETSPSTCSGLGQEACEASGECSVIEGWPMPQACLVWRDELPVIQPQFAACRETVERACPAAFGWAHPADEPDDVWLFSNLCFPDSWDEFDGDPCCVPACDGKECGDDGCDGECGQCLDAFVCVEGLCQCEPDCENKECGENDGCGNPCGDCPLECTDHGECGKGELCLRTGGYYFSELPEPTICGLCGTVTECTCRAPLWTATKFMCDTDADCTNKFFCYQPCGEEPGEIPCPFCVHGWCAYDTFLNDPDVCSGSCGG